MEDEATIVAAEAATTEAQGGEGEEGETTAEEVEVETTAEEVEGETTAAEVEGETTAEGGEGETTVAVRQATLTPTAAQDPTARPCRGSNKTMLACRSRR